MYRKATLDDCRRVYELICEMEKTELPYDVFSSIYQEQLNSRYYYCLICERDEVIGVLNLKYEKQLHHAEWIAEIMEFAVDVRYRSQGIGKEMFAIACKLSKEYSCAQIEVCSNQIRKDAHRFYLREGMQNSHFKFSKRLSSE